MSIERLSSTAGPRLEGLLRALETSGESEWFRPHGSDAATIASLCNPSKKDLHYLMGDDRISVAYGLLRGWDEGFATPSLGIAVHPDWRGMGFGVATMHFLHSAASIRGADRVRLRVHAGNATAIAMYRRLGYSLKPDRDSGDKPLLVGYKDLRP